MALGFAKSLNLSESASSTRDNLILDNLYGDGSIFRDMQLFRGNLRKKSVVYPGEYNIEQDVYDLNRDGTDETLFYFKVGQLIKLLRTKPERIIFNNFQLPTLGINANSDFYLLQIGDKKFASSVGEFTSLSELTNDLALKISNDPEINALYELRLVSFTTAFGGTVENPVEKIVLQFRAPGNQNNIPYILTYEGSGNGFDDSQPTIENGMINQVLLNGTPVDEGLESDTTDSSVYTLIPPFSNKTKLTVYDTFNDNVILGNFEVFDSNAIDRFRCVREDGQIIIPNSPAELGRYIFERSDAVFQQNITNLKRERLRTFVTTDLDGDVDAGTIDNNISRTSVLDDLTIGDYLNNISIGVNILNLKKVLTPKRDVDNLFLRPITFQNSVRIINDDDVQTEAAPGLFIVTDDGTPRGSALRAFSDLSNPWFNITNNASDPNNIVEGADRYDAAVGDHLLTLASSAGIGKLVLNSDGVSGSTGSTLQIKGDWTTNNYATETTPIDPLDATYKLEVLIRTPFDPEGEAYSFLLVEAD